MVTFEHLFFLVPDDAKVVVVPPFADSISEGDVRWDKGKVLSKQLVLLQLLSSFNYSFLRFSIIKLTLQFFSQPLETRSRKMRKFATSKLTRLRSR